MLSTLKTLSTRFLRYQHFSTTLQMSSQAVSTVIVSDWDETITVKDSIAALARLPYGLNPNLSPPWSHFEGIYAAAYSNYKNSADTCDPRQSEEALRAVENSSIDAIEECAIFKGLTQAQLASVADNISLVPEAVDYLQACQFPKAILSVNWSSVPIRESLSRHDLTFNQYFVNEFEAVEGVTTGRWDKSRVIRTGYDKLRIITDLKKSQKVVYIGDSSTDLLALVEADLGIIIRGSSLSKKYPEGPGPRVVVASWDEVEEVINKWSQR